MDVCDSPAGVSGHAIRDPDKMRVTVPHNTLRDLHRRELRWSGGVLGGVRLKTGKLNLKEIARMQRKGTYLNY